MVNEKNTKSEEYRLFGLIIPEPSESNQTLPKEYLLNIARCHEIPFSYLITDQSLKSNIKQINKQS